MLFVFRLSDLPKLDLQVDRGMENPMDLVNEPVGTYQGTSRGTSTDIIYSSNWLISRDAIALFHYLAQSKTVISKHYKLLQLYVQNHSLPDSLLGITCC